MRTLERDCIDADEVDEDLLATLPDSVRECGEGESDTLTLVALRAERVTIDERRDIAEKYEMMSSSAFDSFLRSRDGKIFSSLSLSLVRTTRFLLADSAGRRKERSCSEHIQTSPQHMAFLLLRKDRKMKGEIST